MQILWQIGDASFHKTALSTRFCQNFDWFSYFQAKKDHNYAMLHTKTDFWRYRKEGCFQWSTTPFLKVTIKMDGRVRRYNLGDCSNYGEKFINFCIYHRFHIGGILFENKACHRPNWVIMSCFPDIHNKRSYLRCYIYWQRKVFFSLCLVR